MPAAIRVRPPSLPEERVEELILRLDDVPIPDVPLHVDGLRPTLGSWLYGLFHGPTMPAKPRKRTR